MRRFLRSRKALSPVIAAIILIAVTVAVSIAVAAWMGAITISFMGGAEALKVTNVRFESTEAVGNNKLFVEVMNVGTGLVTISDVKVDGKSHPITDVTVDKGEPGTIPVTLDDDEYWKSGVKYEIIVITAAGNQFPYTARAPY